VIGIDLGTTNSLAAVVEAGVPSVIPNSEGYKSTPSVVAYTKTGELLVGETAKRQAALNPLSTFTSAKRFIGRTYDEVEGELASFPYEVVDAGAAVELVCPNAPGKGRLTPEEVSAKIISKLRDDAAAFLQAKVEKAVVTVPAYFNDAQRQATKRAVKLAGVEVLRICNEPTMAALAYGLDQKNMATVAVLDLGGGTFDVSLLETGDGVCEVLATAGDTHLGGNDFDQRIADWIFDVFEKKEGMDLRKDAAALQRVTEAAEKAKIELSELMETRISVPFIAADADGPKHIDEVITRDAFDEMCADIVQRLREPVLQALVDARMRPKDISEVVMVGGSSRIPAVQALAKELTASKPVNSMINPEEVVAIGAAIQAAMIAGEVQDIMLIDVTPLTLGVETNGGVFSPVVERNSALPTKQTRFFTTSEDAQREIEVVVLQGERPMAEDNKKLGSFKLVGIPPAPAGIPKFEVTFQISIEGILSVTAKDWATRQTVSITLDNSNDVKDEEIDKALEEAEEQWLPDEEKKDRKEMIYSAQCLVRQTEENLIDLGDRVPEDAKFTLMPKLEYLRKAVVDVEEKDIAFDELARLTKDMRFELMKLGQRVYGKQIAPDNVPGPGKPRAPGGVAGGGTVDDAEEEEEE